MATGRQHGRNARIYIDVSSAANGSAVSVSYLNDWAISQTTDTAEVTSFGDATKVYVAGLPDATGTMAGFMNLGTTAFSVLADGNARKMYLYPDGANTSGTYFFGTALFSGNYTGSTGDALKVSLAWNAASSCAWVAGP